MKNDTLCEKYRASCFIDIKGQDFAISNLKSYIDNFPLDKKAIILHGPPGTGKTSLVYALAKESDSEIFELNASDFRNKEKLDSILEPASRQKAISGKSKIILVDEVDGISGYADKGGIPELKNIIEQSSFPVIITANDVWDKKLAEVRKMSELIQLKELNYRIILDILKNIAEKEKIITTDEILKSIAIKSKGDVRAALNDLQTVHEINTPFEISERDKEEDIFNVLRRIFKELTNKDTLNMYDNVSLNLDEIMLWLEENIPHEYSGEELAKAYNALSKADVFRGRIHRQQHWRFLVYQNILMSAGISSAKKKPKIGFTFYKKPSRILKIWQINRSNEKKKAIAEKYAKLVHVGKKRIMHDFPTIKIILKNEDIQKQLKLSEEEIEYLSNQ